MARPSLQHMVRLALHHPRYLGHLVASKLANQSRYRWAERNPGADDRVPPPIGYKLVLTYRCNLRCGYCYQWGVSGSCHGLTPDAVNRELEWEVIVRLLDEGAARHTYVILIGGEPLLYSKFGRLARLLRERRIFAIVCTNGLLLDRHASEVAGNPYLTFLVSLDGPEAQNDSLRGTGVHQSVVANIRKLKALGRPPYIGVELTVRPENVSSLRQFCHEMVRLGVDWILLCPTWFLSPEQKVTHEEMMRSRFGIEPRTHLG